MAGIKVEHEKNTTIHNSIDMDSKVFTWIDSMCVQFSFDFASLYFLTSFLLYVYLNDNKHN